MTTKTFEIEALLPWSEPREVNTKVGPRKVRSADPTEEFWGLWKLNRSELQSAGISVALFRGKWTVSLWERPSKEEVQTKNELLEVSQATDSEMVIPVPPGLSYLPYQKAGIEFASKRNNTLIGDEMGLGKTIQAIGYMNVTNPKKTLIVCPATLKINWRKELEKWLVNKKRISIANSRSLLLADVTIMNYDILKQHIEVLEQHFFDLIIMDEGHYIKNRNAKRTKFAHRLRAANKIVMTGTPILNRPEELFSILNLLDPQEWGEFFKFAYRYCGARRNRFGLDTSGASNLQELQERLRTTLMIRRLKKDVLLDLPPKTRQLITIEQDQELGELVNQEKAILDKAYSYDIEGLNGHEVLFQELSLVRHMQAIAKLPYVFEHIDGIMDEDPRKLVIFAHHRDVVQAVVDHCESKGWNPVSITGGTKMDDRDKAVIKFQTDKNCMIFVGNFKAAGVGITLTESSHVLCIEMDWVPGNITQAEDRCHRIGQRDNVLVQHLVIDGTLDAEMCLRVIEKQNIIDQALDSQIEKKTIEDYDPVKEVILIQPEDDVEYSKEEKEMYHKAIKYVAGFDFDHANVLNGVGFNKFDTGIGNNLAQLPLGQLSNKQAGIAKRLAIKYRGQLPEELKVQKQIVEE